MELCGKWLRGKSTQHDQQIVHINGKRYILNLVLQMHFGVYFFTLIRQSLNTVISPLLFLLKVNTMTPIDDLNATWIVSLLGCGSRRYMEPQFFCSRDFRKPVYLAILLL